MDTATVPVLREQLVERREKLVAATSAFEANGELLRLLSEVDAALERMEQLTYGLCEVCHDPIEPDRLLADPLVRFCLGDLTPSQQRALQEDLELAARIQRGLLPKRETRFDGWEIAYHYEPAGPVSGDYCDLVCAEDSAESSDLYFILGDVSGKGVAASMLMSHLHAMFRSLISVGLPLNQLMERASRVFCESTLPTHFATLVCGRACQAGVVEICNAGHLPPIWLHRGEVRSIEPGGLPVGVFCDEHFSISRVQLEPGDTLLLYTDGLTEARDDAEREFGAQRLTELTQRSHRLSSEALVNACVDEVTNFCAGLSLADDLTIMAIQRRG